MALVPELYCSDFSRSVEFYCSVLGFRIVYARKEENFAFLDREGAQLMLEQPTGRTWLTGPLEQPYGRGVNFEIEVTDALALHAGCTAAGASTFLSPEEKWYRRETVLLGVRQFIVQDPDGYLLRFSQPLGIKSAPKS